MQSSSEVTAGSGAMSSSEFGVATQIQIAGIYEAFYVMEHRRLRRSQHGPIPVKGLAANVMLAVQVLIMFTVLMNFLRASNSTWHVALLRWWQVPAVISAALIATTVVHTFTEPEHTLSAWLSVEVYIWCLWTAWFFVPEEDFFIPNDGKCAGALVGLVCISQAQLIIHKVFLSVLSATCVLHAPHYVIMPCLVSCDLWRGRLVLWWRCVQVVIVQPGLTRFSYKPQGPLCFTKAECTYRGDIDDATGLPHGQGEWSDTSYHGECLRGKWVHGAPAGEFMSRQYGTGAQFQQRGVGYATSRADCKPDRLGTSSLLPEKGQELRYGIGHVEVSFAGGFFPFLPSVEQHCAKESVANMAAALKMSCEDARKDMRHVLSLEVVADEEVEHSTASMDCGLRLVEVPLRFIEGQEAAFVSRSALALAPSLTARDLEALVFIHGYNCDLATALGRIAQTFALGHMEAHVVPFVFSYSGGGPLSYFGAKTQMHTYGLDLREFLSELGYHFREVHILTHSCGAAFFFKNWNDIKDCFVPSRRSCGVTAPSRWVPKVSRAGPDDSRLHLATLTLMNPDVLVEQFVELLPSVMQAAEHLTAYVDNNDGALFWGTWVQKLVPRWYQQRAQPPSTRTLLLGNTLRDVWLDASGALQGSLLEELAQRGRGSKAGADWSDLELASGGDARGGAYIPGDGSIELIDCSNIDANVHNLRHSYYMLNTLMVEDVCEVIGKRLPALYRHRLAHAEANIFNFIAPPK
eukprot:CAMPEP_0204186624 /NCGR_PEP_ID=MMETSP0361-20130328/56148_1 /ASSEMBLY_ACC=CAM_ASM_000343 /TAXON_ID=268821 /ORGANISM="Scrippsiella Hangoei, Strain SHTV-5" /LENGTH=747 /DNA_ID=CAMNT_0051146943 /DNA_START=35 /DNA_END=2275 /DNA_ORIENTATION=-